MWICMDMAGQRWAVAFIVQAYLLWLFVAVSAARNGIIDVDELLFAGFIPVSVRRLVRNWLVISFSSFLPSQDPLSGCPNLFGFSILWFGVMIPKAILIAIGWSGCTVSPYFHGSECCTSFLVVLIVVMVVMMVVVVVVVIVDDGGECGVVVFAMIAIIEMNVMVVVVVVVVLWWCDDVMVWWRGAGVVVGHTRVCCCVVIGFCQLPTVL